MKIFCKKLLICLLLFVLIFNFMLQPRAHAGMVGDAVKGIINSVGKLADGVAGILTIPAKLLIMIGESSLLGLLSGIATTFGYVDEFGKYQAKPSPGDEITFFTPDVIFFNRVLLTDANIFNIDPAMPSAIKDMRTSIAVWYYIMRIIAISILLGILIFIAIRMAISTVASDKARYKEMLVHWASSIALVFVLHYVIVIVCNLNSSLIEILHKIYTNPSASGNTLETGVGTLLNNGLSISFTASWSSLVVAGLITVQTLAFLIYYIKRMLTLSFLVIISPLITITYSIDKLGDGKAQALNAWLKEFFFTVIIQPFHCILYMVFMSMAVSALSISSGGEIIDTVFGSGFGMGSLIGGILAILCIKFIWDGEKIIKNIFGIKVSESLGDAVTSAAVAGAMVSKGMGLAKGAAGAAGNVKNLAVKSGLAGAIGGKLGNLKFANRTQNKINNLSKQADAARAAGNTAKANELDAQKAKQQTKLDNYNAGKGVRGMTHKVGSSVGKTITGAKTKVGKLMNTTGGQIAKRYLSNSAGVAAAVLGGSMAYGSSDKTSLFEAGLAGYGAYAGVRGASLKLMNRKKENYEGETEAHAAVVCNATGQDPKTLSSSDIARMAINASVKNSNGDFKDLKKDKGDAHKKVMTALQDRDRANLKAANPNITKDELNAELAKNNYKAQADVIMQDVENGIFLKDLNLEGIAASFALDAGALRGAVGEYAEKRAYKNMATNNDNLDAMAGQDGYHVGVLRDYEKLNANRGGTSTQTENNTQTQTQTQTNTQTSTESETSTETRTSTETQTNSQQIPTISAEEIASRVNEYLEKGNSGNADLDKLAKLLEGLTPDEQANLIKTADNFQFPYIMDGIVKTPEYFQNAMSEGKSVEVITHEICNEHNVIEEKQIERVHERVEEITKLYELKNVIENIRTVEENNP